MRNPLFRTRLSWVLGICVLAASAIGAARVIHASGARPLPGGDRPAGEPSRAGVVCFGYVDVETGVTPLYPVVPGRVAKVDVRESQAVKSGDVLFRLDDRLAALRVREAEAELKAAKDQQSLAETAPQTHQRRLEQQTAAIEAVTQRLTAARALHDRKRELFKKQQIDQKDLDASQAQVNELEAILTAEKTKLKELEETAPSLQLQIQRAAAGVEAAQARLEQARRGVEECLVRAPVDGTVLRLLVSEGEVLGAQPRQAALMLCPNGERVVRAEVDQEFAGRVSVGQAAIVQDDATVSGSWKGKVSRVSDWFTQRRTILQDPAMFNDTRTLECMVKLEPGQPSLRIGQRVRVTLGGE